MGDENKRSGRILIGYQNNYYYVSNGCVYLLMLCAEQLDKYIDWIGNIPNSIITVYIRDIATSQDPRIYSLLTEFQRQCVAYPVMLGAAVRALRFFLQGERVPGVPSEAIK
jgi:hypothetical protein